MLIENIFIIANDTIDKNKMIVLSNTIHPTLKFKFEIARASNLYILLK